MDSKLQKYLPLTTGKSSASLPVLDDIIAVILSLLPLKSLHKFKWLSKSWYAPITDEILPKHVKIAMLGFFYNTSLYSSDRNKDQIKFKSIVPENETEITKIDQTLSFLTQVPLMTVDHCNGLILLREYDHSAYYVCNPMNKTWTNIPGLDYDHSAYYVLDFYPNISPHFKIYDFTMEYHNELPIRVYASENKTWKKLSAVPLQSEMEQFYTKMCCVWKDSFYVHTEITNEHEFLCAESYDTLRIGLSQHEKNLNSYEFIEFPKCMKKPNPYNYCIGKLMDKLCIGSIDGQRLRVWTLSGECDNMWALEYDDVIPGLDEYQRKDTPSIFGLDHLQNAILLIFTDAIFAYEYKEKKLSQLCRFPPDNEKEFDIYRLFPFYVCSSCFLENSGRRSISI